MWGAGGMLGAPMLRSMTSYPFAVFSFLISASFEKIPSPNRSILFANSILFILPLRISATVYSLQSISSSQLPAAGFLKTHQTDDDCQKNSRQQISYLNLASENSTAVWEARLSTKALLCIRPVCPPRSQSYRIPPYHLSCLFLAHFAYYSIIFQI